MTNSKEKKRTDICQTCREPIYEGEPMYFSTKRKESGYLRGSPYAGIGIGGRKSYQIGYGGGRRYCGEEVSENWVQCAWCYDQWQADVKKRKRFWTKWVWGCILVSIAVIIITIINFPGIEEDLHELRDRSKWIPVYRHTLFSLGDWNIPVSVIMIIFGSIVLTSILGSIFQPKIDRYKLRKRPKTNKTK